MWLTPFIIVILPYFYYIHNAGLCGFKPILCRLNEYKILTRLTDAVFCFDKHFAAHHIHVIAHNPWKMPIHSIRNQLSLINDFKAQCSAFRLVVFFLSVINISWLLLRWTLLFKRCTQASKHTTPQRGDRLPVLHTNIDNWVGFHFEFTAFMYETNPHLLRSNCGFSEQIHCDSISNSAIRLFHPKIWTGVLQLPDLVRIFIILSRRGKVRRFSQ